MVMILVMLLGDWGQFFCLRCTYILFILIDYFSYKIPDAVVYSEVDDDDDDDDDDIFIKDYIIFVIRDKSDQ